MRRTYLLRRSRIIYLIATAVAAIVLAGCGSSSSTATTPAPVAATTTSAAGEFDPSLVGTTTSTSTTTTASGASTTKKTATKKPTSATTAASSAAQALALSSGSAPAATTATNTTAPATTTPVKTKPAKTKPAKPIIKTVTRTIFVKSKPTIKYLTVTKYKTQVVTKTVTAASTTPTTPTEPTEPTVPAGAFLPSVHTALSLTSFIVSGGSVGCVLGGGSVRCDVATHTWTAPAQPSSCTQSWGSAIVLINSGAARLPVFACGGSSALNTHAKVVQNGYDVTVGPITCQVRGFGVDCYATDMKGFILSNTGYILY